MELIADILLVAGALGASLYCFVLSRRLKRFTDLEKGVGGAIAVLSTQADELKKSLGSARDASDQSGAALKDLTQRAESVAQRLELMMASMHDVIPEKEATPDLEEAISEADPEPETVDDPSETPEQQNAAEEPFETSETPVDPDPEDEPAATETRRPGGVMFFRHDRKRDETVT